MLVGSVSAAVASIEARCLELERENGNLHITVDTLVSSEKHLATQLRRCEAQRDRAQEILDALEVERMTRMEEDQASDARMEELTVQFMHIQHRLEKKIAERDRQIQDLQKQLQSAISRPTPVRTSSLLQIASQTNISAMSGTAASPVSSSLFCRRPIHSSSANPCVPRGRT